MACTAGRDSCAPPAPGLSCTALLSIGLNAAPLLAPHTGVGRYILGLAGGLAKIAGSGPGCEFRVRPLFAPEGILTAAGAPPGPGTADPATPLHRLRALLKRLPAAYTLADLGRTALLLAESRHLDVFHETNHAAPRTRLPLVLTIHDLCTLTHPETQDPARARFFAHALRTRARRADQVIAPTAAIAAQLVSVLGLEPARVRAIHHGLDEALLTAPVDPAPLRAQGVSGPFILFVGALEPRKGLPTLLAAYDALPARLLRELPLVLAGPPSRVDPALRAALDRPRAGRVVQLGFFDHLLLASLYRASALLVLPSLYEGFGLPLAEALACGAPCVTSDDPALVEVGAGAALHFPRGDASACAEQMTRLLDDEALRESLRDAGLTRARSFTWEASARAHLAAYRAALEAH